VSFRVHSFGLYTLGLIRVLFSDSELNHAVEAREAINYTENQELTLSYRENDAK
jgi:hypothetical protein